MNQPGFSYDLADEGGASRRFWMDEAPLSRTFSKAIPARAADLLDVVGAIYAADRQSKRCFQGVATGQRRINIRLAVREPEPWSSPELISKLRELLSWISGDIWTIEFAKRKDVYDLNKSEGFLFNLPLRPPRHGLSVQRRPRLFGRIGATRSEFARWLPYPGVRPHPSPTGLPTEYPGTAGQGYMWMGIPRG